MIPLRREELSPLQILPSDLTEYIAKRRQMALDRGLGDKLAAAKEAKKVKE
jgi:hypothetical protein